METNYLTLDSIISKANQESPKSSQKEFLKKIVYNLLIKAGHKFNFTPIPVETIPSFLGINVVISKKLITDAELHKTEKGWSIRISPEQTTHFSGKTVLTRRGRFSITHELAHFLLYYISEKFPCLARTYNTDISQNESKNYEWLCDDISSEFLAPTCLFQTSSLMNVVGDNRSLLDISVLASLQKALNISRFVLIRQLNHTRILEESECGIMISFFNVNRNTGRSPALRVRYRALPRWGFIPENIKLSSIGLSSALHVFDDFGYGISREWTDRIKVQEKRTVAKETERKKWVPRVLGSHGQHVAYPYGESQRCLITTMSWPRPQKDEDGMLKE